MNYKYKNICSLSFKSDWVTKFGYTNKEKKNYCWYFLGSKEYNHSTFPPHCVAKQQLETLKTLRRKGTYAGGQILHLKNQNWKIKNVLSQCFALYFITVITIQHLLSPSYANQRLLCYRRGNSGPSDQTISEKMREQIAPNCWHTPRTDPA